MTIPYFLGHGVLIFVPLLVGFIRPGARRDSATRHRYSEHDSIASETGETIRRHDLPDSNSLAGVPLRILLSDRSGPGALLKDTLMVRPSTRDK